MGLQQFERRLERLVEGVFARAFRSGLQPVEVGRRLAREMDLRRQVAPKGILAPNRFIVSLSPEDRARFAPIEDELVRELMSVAKDHARSEAYSFVGPVEVDLETDDDLSPGVVLVSGEMMGDERPAPGRGAPTGAPPRGAMTGAPPRRGATIVLPDGRRLVLGAKSLVMGRLPECDLVLADPNVSRRHAELRPAGNGRFEVADLGSTNGTRVNGIPVRGAQLLRDGDEITVGATAVRFEQG
ncbi:MAG TPA: DUF3662 and FHA domain-containing protein [Acidimicrobiales bacterium]|jgi:hypothetical protein|nr:DUF3662 and FHA domain-containing protein [Acidimicrobiales bacterium]